MLILLLRLPAPGLYGSLLLIPILSNGRELKLGLADRLLLLLSLLIRGCGTGSGHFNLTTGVAPMALLPFRLVLLLHSDNGVSVH